MNPVEDKKKSTKKGPIIFYYTALLVLLIITYYCLNITFRSGKSYLRIKTNQHGWSGEVFKLDPKLGFSSVPNGEGEEIFRIPPNIPVRFDEHGFRIPASDNYSSAKRRPLVLTFGGSFTFGALVLAENTYPYLTGQYLEGSTHNAGLPSYGLAQMYLLAQALIPKHKPDYVVVQYSDWLTGRSQRPFAPTYNGKLPTPFFVEGDPIGIHPPVFAARIFDLNVGKFRQSRLAPSDAASFLRNVGIPLFLYDDYNVTAYKIKKLFGLIPESYADSEDLEEYVYGGIHKIARANGAKMVMVTIGHNAEPITIPERVVPPGAIVANAQATLIDRLPEKDNESYMREYTHWRGSPPQHVDGHPNAYAHKIIAEEIFSSIKSSATK